MRSLYLDFEKNEILPILQDLVGGEGTLLFPCWHFNVRAEDYIREHDLVFDVLNSPSAMGMLSEVVRQMPNSFRSLHPTNSVVSVGRRARELTSGHEDAIYPCGDHSPFVKMMNYDALIVGIGVTVDNLTFCHTVEDLMRGDFPLETRHSEPVPCQVLDHEGQLGSIQTLVPSAVVTRRNVTKLFSQSVPQDVCVTVRHKGIPFFGARANQLLERMKELAIQGKTIYSVT